VPKDPTTYYVTLQPLRTTSSSQQEIHFTADLSQCVIGDIIWIFLQVSPQSPGSVMVTFADVNLPQSAFFVTACGGSSPEIGFTIAPGKRFAQLFVFDGEKLINTNDNC
jgi:hypothetical protein